MKTTTLVLVLASLLSACGHQSRNDGLGDAYLGVQEMERRGDL